MKHTIGTITVLLMLAWGGATGCQRDNPTANVDMPVDKAAEAIERAINTPIEKAKSVEKTLQTEADRTAEQTRKAGE